MNNARSAKKKISLLSSGKEYIQKKALRSSKDNVSRQIRAAQDQLVSLRKSVNWRIPEIIINYRYKKRLNRLSF